MNRPATIRLLNLFRELNGRRVGISKYDLADRFEVSYKTVERDLEYLRMMNVEVITEGFLSHRTFMHIYRIKDSKCPFCGGCR